MLQIVYYFVGTWWSADKWQLWVNREQSSTGALSDFYKFNLKTEDQEEGLTISIKESGQIQVLLHLLGFAKSNDAQFECESGANYTTFNVGAARTNGLKLFGRS